MNTHGDTGGAARDFPHDPPPRKDDNKGEAASPEDRHAAALRVLERLDAETRAHADRRRRPSSTDRRDSRVA